MEVQREKVHKGKRGTHGVREVLGWDISGLYLPSPPAVGLCPTVQIEKVRERERDALAVFVSISSVSSQRQSTQQHSSRVPSLLQSIFCDGIMGFLICQTVMTCLVDLRHDFMSNLICFSWVWKTAAHMLRKTHTITAYVTHTHTHSKKEIYVFVNSSNVWVNWFKLNVHYNLGSSTIRIEAGPCVLPGRELFHW